MNKRLEGVLVASGILIGIVVIMSMAIAWGPKSDCVAQFPKMVGCALASYENLSGGLIAAGGAVFAGWLAWTAVQLQISADERRAFADRVEVERVMTDDVDQIAESLAAIWTVLEKLDEEDDQSAPSNPALMAQQRDAVLWGIEEIAQEAWIETARKMVSVLGWSRRRQFEQLLTSLARLRGLPVEFDVFDTLQAVQHRANDRAENLRVLRGTYFNALAKRGQSGMRFLCKQAWLKTGDDNK